jgi:hypothetical protein
LCSRFPAVPAASPCLGNAGDGHPAVPGVSLPIPAIRGNDVGMFQFVTRAWRDGVMGLIVGSSGGNRLLRGSDPWPAGSLPSSRQFPQPIPPLYHSWPTLSFPTTMLQACGTLPPFMQLQQECSAELLWLNSRLEIGRSRMKKKPLLIPNRPFLTKWRLTLRKLVAQQRFRKRTKNILSGKPRASGRHVLIDDHQPQGPPEPIRQPFQPHFDQCFTFWQHCKNLKAQAK